MRLAAVAATMLMLAGPLPSVATALSEHDLQIYRAAFKALEKDRWDEARRLAAQARDPLPGKVLEWLDLQRPSNGNTFSALAAFIRSNPDWPNMGALRRQAETVLPADMPADKVREWFAAYPPQTTAGFIRYVEALQAAGQSDKATEMVRQRWIERDLPPSEEQEFRVRFSGVLRPQDHVARLDRLLWDHQDAAAKRLLPLLDKGYEALAQARLMLDADAPGAEAAVNRVPASLRNDPGLLYERLRWRRRKDNDAGALEILSRPPAQLGRPALWWTERQIIARRAIEKGDYKQAYRLAKAHGQTDGLGFMQAEFLAGWLALRFLDNPSGAFDHFHRLYRKVTSPISRSRGAYWCARAADVLGDKESAREWYASAAVHGTTFYGQIAAQKLNRAPQIPPLREPTVTKDAAAEFNKRELVRVVRMLREIEGADGDRYAQFLRKLANDAKTAAEFALAARLAEEIGRADLAVYVAKQAVQDDIILVEGGYPLLDVVRTRTPEPALVLALIRQESTFNPNAVSAAGARGLMQLMPVTAQQVAGKLGLKHSHGKLTADPEYNIQLGSAYLAELVDRFNGSYVLAVAAYNAGPGRVRSWLEQFGDPRAEGIDVVDWIELIPIYETRNYVQRVLESVQVYRARLNGGKAERTLEQDLKR